MALAGGVTIEIPHGLGYPYKEGEILSPDGHCRPFDHRSKGTIFGSGTGVIVLRRLEDAIEDGDHIHGVIIGSAVNLMRTVLVMLNAMVQVHQLETLLSYLR